MINHTPGPWAVSKCFSGEFSVGNFGPGNYLESARCISLENAKLIAAAPELYAALEQAYRFIIRTQAHKGAMSHDELVAAEKRFETVSVIESGRWVGDTVRFDMDKARAALAKIDG